MATAITTRSVHEGESGLTTDVQRQRYAAISRALADPKRLCVLEILSSGERSVGDLFP